MFIPSDNLMTDKVEIIAFMRQYSFATIVTAKDELPTATPLPFTVLEKGDKIVLTSHFAKANKQWTAITTKPVLVIFSEPHAYISPKHYDSPINVPTWNYIAVHAYGTGTLLTDQDAAIATLEDMIDNYDKDYKKQWEHLPLDYKLGMLKGIVPFEITVSELQGKKKLSQNKTATEQHRIVNQLENSSLSTERGIAEYMKKNPKSR